MYSYIFNGNALDQKILRWIESKSAQASKTAIKFFTLSSLNEERDGERSFRVQGEIPSMFGVRCWMFDVPLSNSGRF